MATCGFLLERGPPAAAARPGDRWYAPLTSTAGKTDCPRSSAQASIWPGRRQVDPCGPQILQRDPRGRIRAALKRHSDESTRVNGAPEGNTAAFDPTSTCPLRTPGHLEMSSQFRSSLTVRQVVSAPENPRNRRPQARFGHSKGRCPPEARMPLLGGLSCIITIMQHLLVSCTEQLSARPELSVPCCTRSP